jgi:type IV pilus assembly protein PilY1
MNKNFGRSAKTTLAGLLLGSAAIVNAAPLSIADDPLFLGYVVDPNVFFMLDDSGSMDWEITTTPHWDACGYDASYPVTCTPTLRSDGAFYLYRWRERKLSTDVNWAMYDVSICGSNSNTSCKGTTGFQYAFTNTDNLYGELSGVNSCEMSQTSLQSCAATLANTQSTVQNQTCTGPSTCNAPTGYQFTYCSGNAGTSQRKCGWYTPYNHRWNSYQKDWRAYSADLNVTYYNPATTYAAWPETGMTAATFTSVRSNPQTGQAGYSLTRSLNDDSDIYASVTSGFVYEVWRDTHKYTGTAPAKTNRATGANGLVDLWDEHDRYVVTATGITKYPISYTSSLGVLTEVVGTGVAVTVDQYGRTPDQVRQNIANWYQYYRRRMLMAKGTIGKVVSENDKFRFGLSVINMNATTAVGTTGTASDNSKIFMALPTAAEADYTAHNTNVLTHLYKFIAPGEGTPLRSGLDNAGRYYAGQTVYNTNANTLSSTTFTNPITESCQQNFTVLFTDGYWTTDSASTAATTINDRDGDGYASSDNSQKTTLADVARFYADHDLNAGYPNNVPVIDQNGIPTGTETFQHMITFTAAFGVQGELSDSTDADDLPDKLTDLTTLISSLFTPSYSAKWGKNPWSYDSGKIDDMWHAAYNSNGDFISARTPEDLVNGLNEAMRTISAMTGSSSSVAASSGSYRTDTLLFLAKFVSGDWIGKLEAYALKTDASGNISISTTPTWDAATRLTTQVTQNGFATGRQVMSYNPSTVNGSKQGKGIKFNFPSPYGSATADQMSSAQMAKLVPYSISTTTASQITENQTAGTDLVNWMRGDGSKESTEDGGYLRSRDTLLGDIINSAPQYVSKPDRLYPDYIESKPYSEFRKTYENRTPMIYVGANDGMLHAFNATSGSNGGKEVFSYVPNSVYGRLKNLVSTGYSHKYTVDGSAEVNDAFFGSSWHTVLLGGLSGGGQGIYALDITKGSNIDESTAADTVLWEFTDTNYVTGVTAGNVGSNGDPNLGYTYSRPQVIKMRNGKWVAVFGNGFNNTEADGSASTTGYAYLYFVDMETGKLLRRIDVPTGNTTTPNGLATVTPIDYNNDYVADFIYAGDLYGNLWRFDVVDKNPSNWKLGHNGKAVFTTSTTPLAKPITVKPAVSRHPTGAGVLVFFGSGKYIETNDADSDDKVTQTFYSIWDNLGNDALVYPIPQTSLLQQSITAEVAHSSGAEVRVTSDTTIDWSTKRGWYMDLEYSSKNNGELVATDAIVRGDRVIFISITPSASPCETGGTSWIYELSFSSGARLPYSPIDVNQDGVIDGLDKVTSGGKSVAGGGFKNDNILTSPTILSDTKTTSEEHKVLSTSAGTFQKMGESVDEAMGRTSWRQLR